MLKNHFFKLRFISNRLLLVSAGISSKNFALLGELWKKIKNTKQIKLTCSARDISIHLSHLAPLGTFRSIRHISPRSAHLAPLGISRSAWHILLCLVHLTPLGKSYSARHILLRSEHLAPLGVLRKIDSLHFTFLPIFSLRSVFLLIFLFHSKNISMIYAGIRVQAPFQIKRLGLF